MSITAVTPKLTQLAQHPAVYAPEDPTLLTLLRINVYNILLQQRSRAWDCSINGRLLIYLNREVSSGIAISGLA